MRRRLRRVLFLFAESVQKNKICYNVLQNRAKVIKYIRKVDKQQEIYYELQTGIA